MPNPLHFVAPFLRRFMAILLLLGVVAGCSTTSALDTVEVPQPVSSSKHAVIVVDGNGGKVLFQANAEAPRYPASLTKMMTLYMLFEALDQGRISKSTPIPVSADAARQPPSKLHLRPGQSIDVETAIQALVVKSANDVAAAVGEFLGGSESQFAAAMTARARQIGMRGTVFRNASGLPDEAQKTTARDMALLGMSLRKRFPQYFHYFSQQSFVYNGKTITGHNRLLKDVDGVDGIKTGYIRASGFNVATSVRRGNRSLVVVVMGGETARARNAEVEQLIERYLASASGGSLLTAGN